MRVEGSVNQQAKPGRGLVGAVQAQGVDGCACMAFVGRKKNPRRTPIALRPFQSEAPGAAHDGAVGAALQAAVC